MKMVLAWVIFRDVPSVKLAQDHEGGQSDDDLREYLDALAFIEQEELHFDAFFDGDREVVLDPQATDEGPVRVLRELVEIGQVKATGLEMGIGDQVQIPVAPLSEYRFYLGSPSYLAPKSRDLSDRSFWTNLHFWPEDVLREFIPEGARDEAEGSLTQGLRSKAGARRQYDREGFAREMDRLFEYYGSYGPDQEEWKNQAAAVRRMAEWCLSNWGRQPTESWIKTYIREAEKRYTDQYTR